MSRVLPVFGDDGSVDWTCAVCGHVNHEAAAEGAVLCGGCGEGGFDFDLYTPPVIGYSGPEPTEKLPGVTYVEVPSSGDPDWKPPEPCDNCGPTDDEYAAALDPSAPLQLVPLDPQG